MHPPLSVLDLSPVGAGVLPSQAVRDSVALAKTADALGYARYWVAEHHNMASIATSAPEVLIAAIAAATSRIRVGAGGIMIPNHTPLRVVEILSTSCSPSCWPSSAASSPTATRSARSPRCHPTSPPARRGCWARA
jgi:hypothetical protein